MSHIIRQVAVFVLSGVDLVNCLEKWVETLFLSEKLLLLKVIGRFGAVKARFPEKRLRILHNFMGCRLIEHDTILFRHSSLLFLSFPLWFCSSFKVIAGLVGSNVLRMYC